MSDPVDWRRAFMRLVASYMHGELNTSLDIVDLSPRINQELSEDTIVIRANLNKEVPVSLSKVIDVMDRITVALEFPHVDEYPIAFQGSVLILTFTREEGT